MSAPDWWVKPRNVSIVVDNPSWVEPYGLELANTLSSGGDHVRFCHDYGDVLSGGIAFYLGCVKLSPPEILALNHRNLIVHESALPLGRGFSPLTWQVLEGKNEIPICLLEATEEADAGAIIYRDKCTFQGNELIDEMRCAQGKATVALCMRFMNEDVLPQGQEQSGHATFYTRRCPENSRLDTERTISDQFNLLRTVDNERYPAFFDYQGCRYQLTIKKVDSD